MQGAQVQFLVRELDATYGKEPPSSVAPDPAESRGALPPPQDPSPLRGKILQARLQQYVTGLILRCAGKAGNPFQTTQGNRLSCRDQEGRRVSDEVVPGTSVFSSSETGTGAWALVSGWLGWGGDDGRGTDSLLPHRL